MKTNYTPYLVIAIAIIICLNPDLSFAGTGGEELKTAVDKVVDLAEGSGGKLAAACAFVVSLIAAVKGNILAFGSAFAVGVIAGIGPSLVTSGVTAII